MKEKFHRTILFILILIVVMLSISLTGLQSTQAAQDTPDFSGYLSTTKASTTTYQVTLTLFNFGGVVPPSARWYGPSGEVSQSCSGSPNIIREFVYVGSSLLQTIDHFYISACNREPGQYNVVVGTMDSNFTIIEKKYYVYLPIILKPEPEPQPPLAFSKLTPADESLDLPTNLTLDWDDSNGADSYAYCYDTTDDDACTNWVDTGTTTEVDLTGLVTDTTYYWQARATNALGTTYADSASTVFWSFTTGSGVALPSETVSIPAGNFQMGCDPDHNDEYSCNASELPLHTVYLDAYQIDKYEVTNAQYAQCVVAGTCSAPSDTSTWTCALYYGNPLYDDYPVVYVTWQDAYDYCTWAGMRLPTEAEWEKAAKGTNVWAYPWGDTSPTCTLANFSASFSNQCVGDTEIVTNYLPGASPYGVMNMAGNVWEMVNDWYAADYYGSSPTNNPPGPATGEKRVIRGGSYGNIQQDILAAGRAYDSRIHTDGAAIIGFRCAVTP